MIEALLISQEDWVVPQRMASDVLALQQGDPDALAALLGRYKNRLYRYLLRWVHEPATAEDLFQQTWLRVIESVGRFDCRRNFDPWLFAVARNLAIDHLRRYQPDSLEEPVEESLHWSERFAAETAGALDEVLRAERASLMQEALQAQPPADREILSLRFEEEMKLEEVAEVLGVPLSTVKSRLGRALERLRITCLRKRSKGRLP